MTTTPNASDALKYAAAILRQRTEWTTSSIAGSECAIEHETELDAICEVSDQITFLAAQFGDPRRYSDGRLVTSRTEIQHGLTTEHVWQPDPTTEDSRSYRGQLPSGDPDIPSPGRFEVTTIPETQEMHVRVVRVAAG